MKRVIRCSSYQYHGVTIYEEDGYWYIYTGPRGTGKIEFADEEEAEEYIDENL